MVKCLKILSTQDNYRQCQATQNNLLEFTIVIVNSKFNHNNITGVDAVISINLIGVMFTARIIIHSTEISHNIGIGLAMYFFSYKYQSQFFVTLNNFIVDNNIWQYENGLQSAITALSATTLVLANVSITNNYNMTGLAVYHTAVMVNGTSSLFHNNTVSEGDVPEGDVGAINKSDTSTGVFSTLDDHCRLPDSLMKALLHSPITFKHSISQVLEHH